MSIFDQLEAIGANTAESTEGIEIALKGDVVRYIFDRLEHSGMSKKELAQRLEMGAPQLSKILALDANLTLRTIARIFAVFEDKPTIIAQRQSTHANPEAWTVTAEVELLPTYRTSESIGDVNWMKEGRRANAS